MAEAKTDEAHKMTEEQATEYDRVLAGAINQAFTQMWDGNKKKLREMSKQELSHASFFEGARFMLAFMRSVSEQQAKENTDSAKEQAKG
jgi:hypothetical protein